MPQKKETLPVKVDVDLQNGGTITYANEVIATIAGVATNEIDGVAGMCVSGGFGEILGRNRNITRGVKVEVGSQEAAVDLYVIVEYGTPIQKVAAEVQENVRKALESLTGLSVVRVDVHVQGVSFEKEKRAAQNSIEAAKNPVLTAPKEKPAEKAAPEPVKEAKAEEPLAAEAPAEPKATEEAPEEAPAAAEEEAPAHAAEEAAAPAETEENETAEEKPAAKRRRKKPEAAPEDAAQEQPEAAKGPGGRKRA